MADNPRTTRDRAAKKTVLAEGTRIEPQAILANGRDNPVRVALERPQRQRPADVQPLWPTIRNRTAAISFENFHAFVDRVFCRDGELVDTVIDDPCDKNRTAEERRLRERGNRLRDHLSGVGAYNLLRTAAEIFLLLECGVFLRESEIDEGAEERRTGVPMSAADLVARLSDFLGNGDSRLPYIRYIVDSALSDQREVDTPLCEGVFTGRVLACSAPCLLELIWNYWIEESMQVQTISAIAMRFQNRRSGAVTEPLATLDLDPLRPLSSILWGYIQDEWGRLTVPRRAYEYSHQYGLMLYGKAVPALRPADDRSKFIEAFHNLLYRSSEFFKQDDDTTVIADGFGLLQSLREVHLLLAEGAHNQFGDLPWAARIEMLIQQWILARPEMRTFLQGRVMVPYAEPWMGQVDAMKRLQGWTDVSVTHFRDLAVYGEQLLLSVRYHLWIQENDPAQAVNWARYWRPEIQAYIHAYRAATGADLTLEPVDTTAPGIHMRDRAAVRVKRA